jgi:hypothetical protein
MTEAEWLTGTDPTPMLKFLKGQASDRKLQMFGCACCRRVWHLLGTKCHAVIKAVESFADGHASMERVEQAYRGIRNNFGRETHLWSCVEELRSASETDAVVRVSEAVVRDAFAGGRQIQELKNQTELLRDIFGNPFRPVTILPEWRTSTVLALSQGIYDEKAFDRMPILADALQDAGCDNEQVLGHCRGPGPHVRGCFVMDACLGKQ